MTTTLVEPIPLPVDVPPNTRRLYVVWQHPQTRRFTRVGQLDLLPDGEYAFSYTPDADNVDGFAGFAAFPDLGHRYRSDEMFPFFTNRVLSPRRPEYDDYLDALGLVDGESSPVEILARSGGGRATDTVHVVPAPSVDDAGRQVLRFLASGIRHVDGAEDRLARLSAGAELTLRPEPDNPANPQALLLDVASHAPVGYVPNYLLGVVQAFREGGEIQIHAERVNPPSVPAHVRLLCRLEALADA